MSDGYHLDILSLFLEQNNLLHKMKLIDFELKSMPKIPKNIEEWTNKLPDFTLESTKRFKVKDLNKLYALNKEYNKLKEEDNIIKSKIKLYCLDETLKIINITKAKIE